MSDSRIVLIPEDPRFVPDKARQKEAVKLLKKIAPEAEHVEAIVADEITFFDCGPNFERIICPSCGAEISMEWWGDKMDEDGGEGFELAKYRTPCCKKPATLNDLKYEMPQGFARFALSAANPNIPQLADDQKQSLEQTLGTALRVIYQRI